MQFFGIQRDIIVQFYGIEPADVVLSSYYHYVRIYSIIHTFVFTLNPVFVRVRILCTIIFLFLY